MPDFPASREHHGLHVNFKRNKQTRLGRELTFIAAIMKVTAGTNLARRCSTTLNVALNR